MALPLLVVFALVWWVRKRAMEAASQPSLTPGKDYTGVGVGAFIFDQQGRVLLLKRSKKSRVAPGAWARPGGHVNFGETCEAAVVREIREETGLDIIDPTLLDVTSEPSGGSHWVSIGYTARLVPGTRAEDAKNLEPDKHDELGFFDLEALPEPIADYTSSAIGLLRAKVDDEE
mmetsp:Transcript_98448/g.234376  ORF Transcript_98448/g.234376 Transcript_98448/m.234376 type:complete len:174 (-) Transcript_98448:37-558(-)